MRGKFDSQAVLFTAAIDLDGRIRADHPLRPIKQMADEDLRKMGRQFDAAYATEGRPSVPPERLIKALLLQSLYSIRSSSNASATNGFSTCVSTMPYSTPPCSATTAAAWRSTD